MVIDQLSWPIGALTRTHEDLARSGVQWRPLELGAMEPFFTRHQDIIGYLTTTRRDSEAHPSRLPKFILFKILVRATVLIFIPANFFSVRAENRTRDDRATGRDRPSTPSVTTILMLETFLYI